MGMFSNLFGGSTKGAKERALTEAGVIRRRADQAYEANLLQAQSAQDEIRVQQERMQLAEAAQEQARESEAGGNVDINISSGAGDPLAASRRRKRFFNVGSADGGLSI